MPDLRRRLRGAFQAATSDQVHDAVVDAILEYAKRPERFDISRGVPLDRFLFQAAWRNVANSVETERRRRGRQEQYVAETARVSEPPNESGSIDVAALTSLVENGLTKGERAGLTLVLTGERSTARLAAALELGHLSVLDQRKEVKRFKDRILKRFARSARRRAGSRP